MYKCIDVSALAAIVSPLKAWRTAVALALGDDSYKALLEKFGQEYQ